MDNGYKKHLLFHVCVQVVDSPLFGIFLKSRFFFALYALLQDRGSAGVLQGVQRQLHAPCLLEHRALAVLRAAQAGHQEVPELEPELVHRRDQN